MKDHPTVSDENQIKLKAIFSAIYGFFVTLFAIGIAYAFSNFNQRPIWTAVYIFVGLAFSYLTGYLIFGRKYLKIFLIVSLAAMFVDWNARM